MIPAALLALLLALLSPASAVFRQGDITLTSAKPFAVVGHFAVSPGSANINIVMDFTDEQNLFTREDVEAKEQRRLNWGFKPGVFGRRLKSAAVSRELSHIRVYSIVDDDYHKFLDAESRWHFFSSDEECSSVCEELEHLSRSDPQKPLEIFVPNDNTASQITSATFSGKFTGSLRTHVWYFVVANCALSQHEGTHEMSQGPAASSGRAAKSVHKRMTLQHFSEFINGPDAACGDRSKPREFLAPAPLSQRNANARCNHLSGEEQGLPTLFLSLFLLSVSVSAAVFVVARSRNGRGAGGRGGAMPGAGCHGSALLLAGGAGLQTLSLLCRWLHTSRFSDDGRGWPLLDWTGLLAQHLSQVAVSLLLIFIGFGWTFAADPTLNSRGSAAGWGKQLPAALRPFYGALSPPRVACALAAWHTLLVVLSHSRANDHEWHDYDSWLGVLHLAARTSVSFLFAVGARARAASDAHKPRRQQFLTRMGAYGELFFLALPVTVAVAVAFVAPYWQEWVITSVTMVVQLCALASLAHVLLLDRGAEKFDRMSAGQFVNMVTGEASLGV
jgi:hypothetical protein